MGKRQNKKRLLFRANWLVVGVLFFNGISVAQKANISLYLQNGFFYEMPKLDNEQQIKVDANSPSACDSLVGVLKPKLITQLKTDTTSKYWLLNSFLSFDYEDGICSFVKIQKMRDTLIVGYETFTFLKQEKCWQEIKILTLDNSELVIRYLKSDSFMAFYNQEKTDFPEIDAIKAQFKDAEGILDIDKLGAYLKTKPKELEKYCDF